MRNYQEGKKARRIIAVIFLIIMTIVVGGTYLSQQQKNVSEQETVDLSVSYGTPVYASEQNLYWDNIMDNESNQIEPQDNEQTSIEKTIKVFGELCAIMPPIGFFSRNKRLSAYITVTTQAQSLIDSNQITEGEVLFVFSMMIRKTKNFQKVAMLTALSLPKLDTKILPPIGFKFANDIRANMRLGPVIDESSVQL